jgi:hypothetical protein
MFELFADYLKMFDYFKDKIKNKFKLISLPYETVYDEYASDYTYA